MIVWLPQNYTETSLKGPSHPQFLVRPNTLAAIFYLPSKVCYVLSNPFPSKPSIVFCVSRSVDLISCTTCTKDHRLFFPSIIHKSTRTENPITWKVIYFCIRISQHQLTDSLIIIVCKCQAIQKCHQDFQHKCVHQGRLLSVVRFDIK